MVEDLKFSPVQSCILAKAGGGEPDLLGQKKTPPKPLGAF
jgi:hypothetical protein